MKLSLVCLLFLLVSLFVMPDKALAQVSASTREVRLANDLEVERARLNDLNDRLNAFELELAPNKP